MTEEVLRAVVAEVPDELLEGEGETRRAAYVEHLLRRLEGPRAFVEEAIRAKHV